MNNVISLNTEFKSANFRDHLLAVYAKTLIYSNLDCSDFEVYVLLRSLRREFEITDEEHEQCADESFELASGINLDTVRIAIAEIENDFFDSMTSDNQDEMYSRMCEIITLRCMFDEVYKRKEPLEITQSFRLTPTVIA